MTVFTESSLNDSILFKTLNNQAQVSILINNSIQNSIKIDSSYIEEQLIQIRRTRISPLAEEVLQAFENDDIIVLYSNIAKVPQAIPFIILRIQGKLKAFVFTNNYGTIVENARTGGKPYLNIQMKDLYALMEGAYVALQYNTYPEYIRRSLGLMRVSAAVYTDMFMRILNKEYALSLDKNLYNRVAFCISKFFLEKVWESNNEDVNKTYSINNILGANKTDLLLTNESYNNANINNLEDLIAFLKTLSPRMEKLNLRYFTDYYIRTYKGSAIFGMECLPYFLFTISSALLGSFIVNQPIITDITKRIKNINIFYPELVKVLR